MNFWQEFKMHFYERSMDMFTGALVGFVLGMVCGTFYEWFWLEKLWFSHKP
jgi:hypothetical protein